MPRHPAADRHRAATALMVYGTSTRASEATGVPQQTIRHWRQHDAEFRELVRQAEVEFGAQMRADLAQIVERASRVVLDRLEHGDVVLAASGEQVRVPIKGREAAVVLGIAFDKLRITENAPTRITETRPSMQAVLDMLDGKRPLPAP